MPIIYCFYLCFTRIGKYGPFIQPPPTPLEVPRTIQHSLFWTVWNIENMEKSPHRKWKEPMCLSVNSGQAYGILISLPRWSFIFGSAGSEIWNSPRSLRQMLIYLNNQEIISLFFPFGTFLSFAS